MFHKKKFTLVEEKHGKIMYWAKNVQWLKHLVMLALAAFVLLMILANVKSKTYYQNLNSKENVKTSSGSRSILSLEEMSTTAINCAIKSCTVTCSGDMVNLNKYLETQKNICPSITLYISDCLYPEDRLQSNWLEGSFNLSYIEINGGTLSGIDDGAFNQKTVAYVTQLVLKDVQLQILTEDTFVGLTSMETFTLVNRIETFSGNGFLKPMAKTITKITIKHVTSTAADPAPWLSGVSFPKLITIVFDGSNFGGYLKAETFSHLKALQIITMNSCQINYIADGAFDFMMSHMVVLVSLRSNQLKRLNGKYLTQVNVLKGVDIQYNPWDCTCELEVLINEYKRYPSGFGESTTENSKCSTPSINSGKILSEVTVESCEDTTISVITTTLSTTKTTTITTSTTEVATSSSTEPSASTIPITSTTELATFPKTTTQASSTTSHSIAMPTTMGSSSTTFEEPTTTIITTVSTDPVTALSTTLSTSTLYIPDHTASTTSSTTSNDDGITTTSPQTTPSPQNRTTTLSADTIFIECERYTVSSVNSVNSVELSRPDTPFDIERRTRTSAQLIIENPIDDLALIWFYDQPSTTGSGENVRIVGEFKVGCQSQLEDALIIEGLSENQVYTFCLVKEGMQVISPFNCRSYSTIDAVIIGVDEDKVWLKYEDKALTIGLFIFGILISLCIGIVVMFLVLRFNPVLLKGSKRVIVVNRSTGDVLIMPRPGGSKSSVTESSYRNSYETKSTIRKRRYSETSIQSGRSYMMANNYEDIEYRWKMNIVNDLIYANRVPKSPPPPLPKRVSQDLPLATEYVDKIKITDLYKKGNDYMWVA